MTIKRKLLFSNILVIVLPTFAVCIIGLIFFFVVYGIEGKDASLDRNNNRIDCVSSADAAILSADGSYQQLSGDVTVYRNSENAYILAFENATQMPNLRSGPHVQRHAFIVGLIISVILIFFLNRLLALHILRSIVNPLDILTDGVKEISNGNLEFRINYQKKDEFASVCSAFNDMATRLSDMTLQQQKEEQNRKVLIAGISHDLRTPLTSIKAYVVGLETGVATTAAMQKKYLATINQKAAELEYIINQLFVFSKLDVGDYPFLMEPVNIGTELKQLVYDMRDEYLQKGVELLYSDLPTDAICTIDVIQFGNVIQNIWSNTAKYKKKDTAHSSISCKSKQNTLYLSISDDGPGVPEDALDKLFDIFYRTDASRQNVALGSGLGLAISAKIIHSFHGTIQAENLAEGGLCITITLPLTEDTL